MTNTQSLIDALERVRAAATFPAHSDDVVISRDAYSVLVRVLSTLRYQESKEAQ